MPGFIAHAGAIALCVHGGSAQPGPLNPFVRVRVSGQPIVLQPYPHLVAGCAFPPPPGGNGPCVTAVWVNGSIRVRAGGLPLLLFDSKAICQPTGTPANFISTQTRARAI